MDEITNNKKPNYFIRLYKGEIPLVATFWIWFVIPNILLSSSLLNSYLEHSLDSEELSKIIFVLFFVISLIFYAIFILVALWRSASKYQGFKFWSNLIKLAIIFNVLALSYIVYEEITIIINDEKSLANEIRNLNKETPIKIDLYTSLTKVSINKKDIYYTYKFHDYEQNKLSVLDYKMFKDDIVKSDCEDLYLINLTEEGYTFNYSYENKFNFKFSEIKISKEVCDNINQDEKILRKILSQSS